MARRARVRPFQYSPRIPKTLHLFFFFLGFWFLVSLDSLKFISSKFILIMCTEIIRLYGSDLTKSGLMNHLTRDISPNVKALKQAADQDQDPKSVVLIEGVRSGKPGKGQKTQSLTCYTLHVFLRSFLFQQLVSLESHIDETLEIVKRFGSETTVSGLQSHIRRDITPNVKSLNEAFNRGDDPKNVVLMENVRDGKTGKGQMRYHCQSTLHVFLTFDEFLQQF